MNSLIKEYTDTYENRELYMFNYPWFSSSKNSDRLFETAFSEDLNLNICLEKYCKSFKVMYYTDIEKDIFGNKTVKKRYSNKYFVYKNSYIMEKDNKPISYIPMKTEEVAISKHRIVEIDNIPIETLKDISKIEVNLKFVKNKLPKFQDVIVAK